MPPSNSKGQAGWQEQSTGLVCAGTGRSCTTAPGPGLGAELFTLRFGPLLNESVCWEVFPWGPRQTRNLTPGEVRPHPAVGSSDLRCFLHPEGEETRSLEPQREEPQRGKWPLQSMALCVPSASTETPQLELPRPILRDTKKPTLLPTKEHLRSNEPPASSAPSWSCFPLPRGYCSSGIRDVGSGILAG